MHLSHNIYKSRLEHKKIRPEYTQLKDMTKNFEKKFGGSPHFSPSKKVAQENDPTMAAYDPHFLSQNLFLL